jgi:hypothetical protein
MPPPIQQLRRRYPWDGGNGKATNGTSKSCTVNTADPGAQELAKRWVPAEGAPIALCAMGTLAGTNGDSI